MESIVMIGGGVQQVRAVKTMQDAGYNVIVTDKTMSAPCFDVADQCVLADGKDPESIIGYILENKERLNIQGVFSLVNLTTTASIVAKACGLPGIDIDAAVRGQNKSIMKRIFKKHGIATPDFCEVRSVDEARQAFARFDGDVFIKPATSFGGQGTLAVNDEQVLIDAITQAQGYSGYHGVLIEEKVNGHFIDLNGMYDGESFYSFGHVDSYFTVEYPKGTSISPIETYVRCPSTAQESDKNELSRLLEQGTRALGIDFGPVGADGILTEKGPMLIEVAPRLHGAAGTLYMFPHALGIKPVKAVADVSTGKHVDLSDITPQKDWVAMNELPLWKPGKIKKIEGYEEALALPGVVHIFLHKKEGDVIQPYKNSTMIPCSIHTEGSTEKEARQALEAVKNTLKITIADE